MPKIISLLLFFSALEIPLAKCQLDTTGLLAHWSFDGNLTDVTGNGSNASSGAYTPVYGPGINGQNNSACLFTYPFRLNASYPGNLFQYSSFSICAVVKPSNLSWSTILGCDASINGPILGLDFSDAGQGTNYCFAPVAEGIIPYPPTERADFQYPQAIAANRWYYVVVTYDGYSFSTYVDGMLKKRYYRKGAYLYPGSGGNHLTIGHFYNSNYLQSSNFFQGTMDDLRLYNRALNDSEIVQYKFDFYDTAVTISQGDSVVCSGSILNVKYIVSKPFRNINTFTVQLSDSNGSFSTPTTIGNKTTNVSGTVICSIPSTIQPGRYKIRLTASAPADTSLEYDINYHPTQLLDATISMEKLILGSIFRPGNGICESDQVTLFVHKLSGYGETPASYTWQKNGVDIPNAHDARYIPKSINNLDSFRCILTSNHPCWFNDTGTTGYRVVSVTKVPVTSVTIEVAPSDSICVNDTATFFIKNKQNAGLTQWHIKNSTFSFPPGDTLQIVTKKFKPLDTFYCTVSAAGICASQSTTLSNEIVIYIDSAIAPPKATITAIPGATVLVNTDIAFTAQVKDTGAAPSYQWYKNDEPIPGATTTVLFAPFPMLNSDDKITFSVHNTTDKCVSPDSVLSNSIHVSFLGTGIAEERILETLAVVPNPNNGHFRISGICTSAATIRVTDLLGKIVYQTNLLPVDGHINHDIFLTQQPTGFYLLYVGNETSQRIARFVIK